MAELWGDDNTDAEYWIARGRVAELDRGIRICLYILAGVAIWVAAQIWLATPGGTP